MRYYLVELWSYSVFTFSGNCDNLVAQKTNEALALTYQGRQLFAFFLKILRHRSCHYASFGAHLSPFEDGFRIWSSLRQIARFSRRLFECWTSPCTICPWCFWQVFNTRCTQDLLGHFYRSQESFLDRYPSASLGRSEAYQHSPWCKELFFG